MKMGKSTKYLMTLFVLCLAIFILIKIKVSFAPNLATVTPNPDNKIEEILSPNGKSKITIYLSGSVIWKEGDYSFIGQVSKSNGKKTKSILWLPKDYTINWVSNHTIKVNNKVIDIKKNTYDFRWE